MLIHESMEEILPTMEDNSVDLVLTDPPYGTTKNKWDVPFSLDFFWEHVARITKPGTPIISFAKQPFSSVLINSNLAGYKHQWIWEKNRGGNFAVVKFQPYSVHEEILVFSCRSKGKINYFPIMVDSTPRNNGGKSSSKNGQGFGGVKNGYFKSDKKHPRSILKYPTVERRDSLHASQKPVALLEYIIETYTKPGYVVLDPFVGSGSTLIACLNTGRLGKGIEKDTEMYHIAKERIDNLS